MIRPPFTFCLACVLAASTQLQAHTATLSRGHVDVGVGYEAGEWDLHVHDEERDIEYEPDIVVLEVHGHGMRKVPDDPRYGFLGKAGRPIWVLPEVEDHDLLFLGLAAEEVETGVFVDDQITLSLKSVTGPGEFFLYHTDALGTPVVSMNSADGVDEGDARMLVAGSHSHANWVFTSPGSYRIGLQASGVLTSDGSVSTSEIAEYRFEVEPARLGGGHVDVGVGFEDGEWELHVHDEETDTEFKPGQVVLKAHGHALRKVPDDARFAFLGAAGNPIWVLPEVEDHGLLFLGLAAEEVETGVFVDDQITLSLKSVTGPGEFFVYHTDALGMPVVSMNSRDGIDEGDARTLVAGSHSHVNWVFTSPGSYRIGLQASGVLTSDGSVSTSEIAEYRFEVEYTPILWVAGRTTDSLVLEWLSREHHEYHLESTSDPVHGPWEGHPGVDPMEGDGHMMSVEVQVGDTPRFFRLEIHEEHGHGHHHHD
jgi:surface-anchored protein